MKSVQILTVGLLFSMAGGSALAQEVGVAAAASERTIAPGASAPPTTWGTAQPSVLNLNAYAFDTFAGASVHAGDGNGGRFMVSGNTCFEASLNLPTGAIIDHVDLEACDTTGSDVAALIFTCTNGACAGDYPVQTTGTPGCVVVSSAAGTAVVANSTSTRFVQVCTGATGAANSFRSVRVFYKLQVSPAPAVATFPNDVPTTSPFFRFVEALASSGLTGGCGPSAFCPDQPVTRAQMAVFLASALGLNFPN
jgi:S-layer family protein